MNINTYGRTERGHAHGGARLTRVGTHTPGQQHEFSSVSEKGWVCAHPAGEGYLGEAAFRFGEVAERTAVEAVAFQEFTEIAPLSSGCPRGR